MKEYEVLYGEKPLGRLRVWPEGLYTHFSAGLPKPAAGGLFRLWLVGEGEYALGLMEPKGESLQLHRRLTKQQLKGLPRFSHGLLLPADSVPQRPKSSGKDEGASVPDRPKSGENHRGDSKLPIWTSRPDGTLVRPDRGRWLIAIPTAEGLKHPGMRFIYLNGKKYTLFRY